MTFIYAYGRLQILIISFLFEIRLLFNTKVQSLYIPYFVLYNINIIIKIIGSVISLLFKQAVYLSVRSLRSLRSGWRSQSCRSGQVSHVSTSFRMLEDQTQKTRLWSDKHGRNQYGKSAEFFHFLFMRTQFFVQKDLQICMHLSNQQKSSRRLI